MALPPKYQEVADTAREWPVDDPVPEMNAPVTDMLTFYVLVLAVLVLSCSVVIGADLYRKCKNELPKDARNLQSIFLLGYLLCAAADWLQGPYIYALYAAYGFSAFELAVLFVTGFTAAMIFGPAVGAFADRFGRKRCIVLLYCFAYTASCVTKHFNVLWVLLLGRILGGIATSALFCAFESWLVGEANKRGLAQASLDAIFSNMYFANGLMAILMGMLAEFATGIRKMSHRGDFYVAGYLAPFDLSLTLCLLAALIIGRVWGENKPEVSNPANGRYFEQIVYVRPRLRVCCATYTSSCARVAFAGLPRAHGRPPTVADDDGILVDRSIDVRVHFRVDPCPHHRGEVAPARYHFLVLHARVHDRLLRLFHRNAWNLPKGWRGAHHYAGGDHGTRRCRAYRSVGTARERLRPYRPGRGSLFPGLFAVRGHYRSVHAALCLNQSPLRARGGASEFVYHLPDTAQHDCGGRAAREP